MSEQLPALLGGDPVFAKRVPMVRPSLPPFAEMEAEVRDIMTSGMLTKSKYLRQFEEVAAEQLQVKHVVAVSSCTSGLMLSYQSLGLKGDVIVPSFTFMATVSAAVWVGCRPVFVDVDKHSTNSQVDKIEAAITPDTTAILAVHNFGNPVRCDELEAIAQKHSLKLIFDAAHGLGSLYHGKPVGSQGDAQCFSLSPTKLVTGGEGGIVATNNSALAEALLVGREYGNNGEYDSAFAGFNARMPEFNAILARHSLGMLEQAVTERNRLVRFFRERLEALPGIKCQSIAKEDRSSYKDLSITVEESEFGLSRDRIRKALLAEGIDTCSYYDPPVHRQTAYRHFGEGADLPNTEWLSKSSISLPLWSKMDPIFPEGICLAMEKIAQHAKQIRSTT